MRHALTTVLATTTFMLVGTIPASANEPLATKTATVAVHDYLAGDWKTLTANVQDLYPTVELAWCYGYVGVGVRETRRRIVYQVAASCPTSPTANEWPTPRVTAFGEAVVRRSRNGLVFRLRQFVPASTS